MSFTRFAGNATHAIGPAHAHLPPPASTTVLALVFTDAAVTVSLELCLEISLWRVNK